MKKLILSAAVFAFLVPGISSAQEKEWITGPRISAWVGTWSGTSFTYQRAFLGQSHSVNTGYATVVKFPRYSEDPLSPYLQFDWNAIRKQRATAAANDLKFQVNFDFDSTELDDDAQDNLVGLAEVLHRNPEVGLVIEGHTDLIGEDDYNFDLSLRRAKAVQEFLTEAGVPEERVQLVGFGKTLPLFDLLAPNRDNRRVETGGVLLFPLP